MADALKIKIVGKVTNMRSEKKLKDVLKCVEKITSTQTQLSLVPAGPTPKKQKSASSDDGNIKLPQEGPLRRGDGPARWTAKELRGELDKFNYTGSLMSRDVPPNYSGPPIPRAR